MEKIDIYNEVGANYRFFLNWRHKALAGYLISIAGLTSILSWSFENDYHSINTSILFISCIVSLVFWGIDIRIRKLYNICQKVGSNIEKKHFHEEIQNNSEDLQLVYTALNIPDGKITHSRILNILFGSAAICFFVLTIMTGLPILKNFICG